jgi:Fur family transcriptional regulator, ferric uptake regulator
MSRRKQTPPSYELIREKIRGAGLRATPGRIAVMHHLQFGKQPQSHAELVDKLGEQGPDASTVFRALNDLAEAGLLRRMELGDHAWRYELADSKAEGNTHPHFICVECGKITCLAELDLKLVADTSPSLRDVGQVSEVLLRGHCTDCR